MPTVAVKKKLWKNLKIIQFKNNMGKKMSLWLNFWKKKKKKPKDDQNNLFYRYYTLTQSFKKKIYQVLSICCTEITVNVFIRLFGNITTSGEEAEVRVLGTVAEYFSHNVINFWRVACQH